MEIVVVVEIPRGGRSKFEIDPGSGTIWLDRVLSTATQYPAEYGYIRDTASGDGDPLDAVVLLEEATVPGCHVRARPIGVLMMSDEMGPDPKVLCVALGDPTMGDYHDVTDVPHHLLDEIEHFFRVYKALEPTKHVETAGWHAAPAAEELVEECRRRAATIGPLEGRTVDLKLDDAQRALLQEILDHALRDLSYEIADTDNSEYKTRLRAREQVLHSILEEIGGPLADPV